MGTFYILTDIREHVTLVHLMEYLGNMNHDISVLGYWIFGSNYEMALVLVREFLVMICAPYFGKKQVATFERVLFSVRHILSTAHLKK